jgi:hypothetical protein
LDEQGLGALDPRTLLDRRTDRLGALVRAHPREIERDDHGAPAVRGEVLAIAPSAETLAAARHAGFEIVRETDPADAVALVVVRAPPGLSARDAVKRMRRIDPGGVYDFNHLYEPSGGVSVDRAGARAPMPGEDGLGLTSDIVIGLVDTGVDTSNPVFAHSHIEQKGFAGVGARPAEHGTAVASLMVGEAPPFQGGAPHATLYAADVYGGAPTGGSAEAIARALGWLAGRKAGVINVSLVGPANAALGAVIKAVQRQGVTIVAAVGNDGPAAPPAYPASYPGVIAVTGVDARGHVLLEAGAAQHLDFAAPGADMAAGAMGAGFVAVRGTSFASPLVASRLAVVMRGDDPRSGVERLAAEAKRQSGCGRGLIAADLRTPPGAVHARPATF